MLQAQPCIKIIVVSNVCFYIFCLVKGVAEYKMESNIKPVGARILVTNAGGGYAIIGEIAADIIMCIITIGLLEACLSQYFLLKPFC